MNRSHIVLVVFVLHSIGCSRETTSPSTPPESPTSAESKSSVASTSEGPPSQETKSETPPSDAERGTKDAMTLYREAQALMKEGKREEGHETAQKAMVQFVAEDIDLPWMILESIEAGDKRVDVHFNMGEREREMPDDGIVRPLSFRIWTGGDAPALSQVIDFEIGRSDGESVTAAIGEMTESGHANYGILDVDATYETIRQRVVDLVTQE